MPTKTTKIQAPVAAVEQELQELWIIPSGTDVVNLNDYADQIVAALTQFAGKGIRIRFHLLCEMLDEKQNLWADGWMRKGLRTHLGYDPESGEPTEKVSSFWFKPGSKLVKEAGQPTRHEFWVTPKKVVPAKAKVFTGDLGRFTSAS